jgi:O-antigen/teichoic acid export membrane protein
VVLCGGFVLAVLPATLISSQYRWSSAAMLLLLIPISYTTIMAETYRGLQRIAAYQIFHVNGFLLAATASGIFALLRVDSAVVALGAYGLSAVLVAVTAEGYWRHIADTRAMSESRSRDLLRSGTPLIWVTFCQVAMFWIPIPLLKLFAEDADAGQFAVAARMAQFVTIGLVLVNSIAGPKFAEVTAKKDQASLEAAWGYVTFVTVVIGSPGAIALVVFSEEILSILFGAEFQDAAAALKILVFGQFVNVLCGSVQLLLLMSGFERVVSRIYYVTSGLMLLSLAPLILAASSSGAALAVASAMAFQNLWMARQAKEKLNLRFLRAWTRSS